MTVIDKMSLTEMYTYFVKRLKKLLVRFGL